LIRNFSSKINFSYVDFYISDEELAIIASSVKTGWGALSSSKTIGRVFTSEAYYVFKLESNGSITIKYVYDLGTYERIINYLEEKLKNDGKGLETIGTLNGWFDIIRDAERRYYNAGGIDDQQTERGGETDGVDGRSSEGYTGTDRNSSPENRRQGSIEDTVAYSYTPDKEATVDELVSQFEDGRITREELIEALANKKPKTDPISLAKTTPEDFNTTPPAKRKTGEAKTTLTVKEIQP
jgi:hypothetical protein